MLITTNTTHAANEHLYKKLPYDPVKDFAPVTGLGKGGQVLVVQPSVAAQERGRPDRAREEEARQADLRQRQLVEPRRRRAVPADGRRATPARAVQEQPAGGDRSARRPDRHDDHRHRDRPAAGQGRQAARARRIEPKRSPLLPDVPTIDEAGVKGYDMGYWFAAYVPAGTPQPVVDRLHELLTAAAKAPATQTFYSTTGTDLFLSSPAELAKFQAAESQRWGKVVKAAGIEPE